MNADDEEDRLCSTRATRKWMTDARHRGIYFETRVLYVSPDTDTVQRVQIGNKNYQTFVETIKDDSSIRIGRRVKRDRQRAQTTAENSESLWHHQRVEAVARTSRPPTNRFRAFAGNNAVS